MCLYPENTTHSRSGGSLSIIGLIAAGEPFPGGVGDDSVITIPAFMINQASGDILRSGEASVRFDPNNITSLVMSMVDSSSRDPANQTQAIKPEIGAPGASVSAQVGTGVGQTPFSGTSGAAPMVAGAAALLMDVHRDRPEIGPGVIKQLLVNTGETDIFNRVSIDSHKKIREAEGGYNGLDNVRGMRHSSRMIIATWFSEGGIPRVLYPTPQLVYPQTILSSTSRSLPQRFSEIGPTYPCSTGPHSGAKRLRSRGHVGSR